MNSYLKLIYAFSLLLMTISFTSCLEDSCEETRHFVEFEALYAHPDEFRVAPQYYDDRKLEYPGKIYYYDNMIMINEKYEGIHIFDNTDASNPTKLGFLGIPGNLDVSIRDNIMYADSYVDLLTLDVADIKNPVVKCRDEEVFTVYNWQDEIRGYYVGTKETNRTIEVDCSDPNFRDQVFWRGGNVFLEDAAAGNGPAGNTSTSTANNLTGVGGSFARFSVIDDFLYVINQRDLVAYNLELPTKPVKTQTTAVNWNIETLFPYNNYLFIGGNNGMFIYDRVNPAAPAYVSEFRHARACDPVFVRDDIAYVTLRNGNLCQNFINQLDVLDVSDINNPQLIESFSMEHPHGLTVRDNNLYICEGAHGLKVFENDDLNKIDDNRIEHVKDIHAYDAISLSSGHLLIIGDDGLYQYDSTDPSDLKELSFISSTPTN